MAVGVVLHYWTPRTTANWITFEASAGFTEEGMWLDRFTVRNLEILHPTIRMAPPSWRPDPRARPWAAGRCDVLWWADELKAIEARHDAVDVSLKK